MYQPFLKTRDELSLLTVRVRDVLQNPRNNGMLRALVDLGSEEGLADLVATMSRGLDPIGYLIRFYQRPSSCELSVRFHPAACKVSRKQCNRSPGQDIWPPWIGACLGH